MFNTIIKIVSRKWLGWLLIVGSVAVYYGVVHSKSIAGESSMSSSSENGHVPVETQRLHVKGYVNAVAWNADGSRLAALSNFGGTITLWETKNWTVLKEFDRYGGAYSFNSLAFLPEGSLLTSAPIGDPLRNPIFANLPSVDPKYEKLQIFSFIKWNPEAGKSIGYIPDLGYPPQDLSIKVIDTFAVSKDGALIAGAAGHNANIYEAKSGFLVKQIPIPKPLESKNFHDDSTASVVFSPDSRELVVGTMTGKLYFFGLEDGMLRRSFNVFPTEEYYSRAIAFSPDGKFIAIGKSKIFNVPEPNNISTYIWRMSDGTMIASLKGSTEVNSGKEEASNVNSISWSEVGNTMAVGSGTSLRLWKITENTQTLLLNNQISGGIYSTAFSSQGVLAASNKNQVIIYQ